MHFLAVKTGDKDSLPLLIQGYSIPKDLNHSKSKKCCSIVLSLIFTMDFLKLEEILELLLNLQQED